MFHTKIVVFQQIHQRAIRSRAQV